FTPPRGNAVKLAPCLLELSLSRCELPLAGPRTRWHRRTNTPRTEATRNGRMPSYRRLLPRLCPVQLTDRRLPHLAVPVVGCRFRSNSPLRGSPGITPGSLLPCPEGFD